jgi:hypothetical protein
MKGWMMKHTTGVIKFHHPPKIKPRIIKKGRDKKRAYNSAFILVIDS